MIDVTNVSGSNVSVAGRFPLLTSAVNVHTMYPKPALQHYRISPAYLEMLLVSVICHHFVSAFLDVNETALLKALT